MEKDTSRMLISSNVVARITFRVSKHDDDEHFNSSENEESTLMSSLTNGNDDDDDGSFNGEGECKLCKCCIYVTDYLLVPRSTWPQIEARLVHSLKTDPQHATVLVGEGCNTCCHLHCFIVGETLGRKFNI